MPASPASVSRHRLARAPRPSVLLLLLLLLLPLLLAAYTAFADATAAAGPSAARGADSSGGAGAGATVLTGRLLVPARPGAAAARAAVDFVPLPEQLLAHTHVLLDGGARIGHLRSDAVFVLSGIEPGLHLLEVACPGFVFDPVRIDVSAHGSGRIRAFPADFLAGPKMPTAAALPVPLQLHARGPAEYFERHDALNVRALLSRWVASARSRLYATCRRPAHRGARSPMVIMMGISVALMFLLPRLMSSIDAGELHAMQEAQPTMPSLSSFLSQITQGAREQHAVADSGAARPSGGRHSSQ